MDCCEKRKLLVSITQPWLFPFKLLLADERGERKKDRRWDRELSVVWCVGTASPALISSDCAASPGPICSIAVPLQCAAYHLQYWSALFCPVERGFIYPVCLALNSWTYNLCHRWLVYFATFFDPHSGLSILSVFPLHSCCNTQEVNKWDVKTNADLWCFFVVCLFVCFLLWQQHGAQDGNVALLANM